MKKILLLLLFTIASYGQAVFDEGIQLTNTESTTATKVNVQEANGKVNTKTINTAFNKNFGLNTGDVVGATTLLNQYATTPSDWTAQSYVLNSVVFYGGKQWIAKIATIAEDVPAVSSKWEEITFEALASKTTTVDQTIIDGSTNAVSGNAVFDGLATKFPTPTGLTTNFLPKWNGSGFVNSQIFDNGGTDISIINGLYSEFSIKGNQSLDNGGGQINFSNQTKRFATISGETESPNNGLFIVRNLRAGALIECLRIIGNGNVGIGTTTITDRLTVNGTISASPATTANQVPTWGQVQAVAGISGRYTPTGNVITGAASVSAQSHTYIKIGNIVTVYGESLPTSVATSVPVIYEISLPIARANTVTKSLGFGTMNVPGGSTIQTVRLESSSATTVRISFNINAAGTPSVLYSFQYDITQ